VVSCHDCFRFLGRLTDSIVAEPEPPRASFTSALVTIAKGGSIAVARVCFRYDLKATSG